MEKIFQGVIKNENQFSKLLVNLLNQSAETKTCFQNFLFSSTCTFEIGKIENQKRDVNGQPDINFSLLKHGVICGTVIIEVKTKDSLLTKNQPEGYVKKIISKDGSEKYLFFLIPKHYAYEKQIIKNFPRNKKNIIHFEIKYWNELVNHLKNFGKFEKYPLYESIIRYLDYYFGYQSIKFSPQQLVAMQKTEVPSTVLKLNKLVEAVAKSLGFRNIAWEVKWDEAYGQGYGFWFDKHFKFVWVGYDFDLWEKTGSAFIMWVNTQVSKESFDIFDRFCIAKGLISMGHPDYSDIKYVDLANMIQDESNTENITALMVDYKDYFTDHLNS